MKRLILAVVLLPSLAFAQPNYTVQLTPYDYEVVSGLFKGQDCDKVCDTWMRIRLQVMQQQHDQAVRQLAQEQQAAAAKAAPSVQSGRVFTPVEPQKSDVPRTSPWPTPGTSPAETPAQH